MIYFQTPLGDVDFYANGGEVQPNCHPIYDPQCSIGAAYKLLTHHYNVSMKIFSKLIIKILSHRSETLSLLFKTFYKQVHVKCATNVVCDSRNFPTHPLEVKPECKKLQEYEDLPKKVEYMKK